jgi:hypothetical protein
MSLLRSFAFKGGIALLFVVATQPTRADLIVNGSFEIPVTTAGSSTTLSGGSTIMTGWTVVGVDVLLLNTTYGEPGNGVNQFNASSGLNSVDLTGAGNTGPTDGVTQTVATTSGQTYLLSFDVGRASGGSLYATPATDDLSINGGPRISFTNSNSTPGMINWHTFTQQFVATGASTTITFLNGTPAGTSEAGLDNVSLVAVAAIPEPSVMALAGFGLAGILGVRSIRGSRRSR